MLEFLQEEGISSNIIDGIKEFRKKYSHTIDVHRVPVPRYKFYGNNVWEQAAAAILCGQNLLLVGQKASGKNILAENLAATFNRPIWDISCHVNMDADALIGTDTFKNGQVEFRPGPVYSCAKDGGFGILDEINMAKNETLAVLHSLLDFRRVVDVPGYERLQMNEATRFIATMNYGYAGTRELNEALASRFVVIMMPDISEESLSRLLSHEFPTLKEEYRIHFSKIFIAIQQKCGSSEISARLLDLRGFLDAIRLMRFGIAPLIAFDMGITNKSFDEFEKNLVKDVLKSRISEKLESSYIFNS